MKAFNNKNPRNHPLWILGKIKKTNLEIIYSTLPSLKNQEVFSTILPSLTKNFFVCFLTG